MPLTVSFDIKGAKLLIPVVACNLHGVWEGEAVPLVVQVDLQELLNLNALVSNTSCMIEEASSNQFGRSIFFNESVQAGELCSEEAY